VSSVKKYDDLIILKLGGSLITSKNEPFSLRKEIIQNSINEIIRSNKRLILVHGGGAFGHPVAQEYEISKGKNNSIENQIYGLSKTHEAMIQLNSYIIEKFLELHKPTISIQTSSIFIKNNGDFYCNLDAIKQCLKLGILPVLYGDIVFSSDGNFSILSGDKIILLLCQNLKEFNITKVIFAFEEDGIYLYNKTKDKIEVAEEIKCNDIGSLPLANLGKKIDVTGGIKGKLDNIKSICKLNIPVQVLNGLVEGNIFKALNNKELKCTNINI
jgi:isopentenyl phosphate kinase